MLTWEDLLVFRRRGGLAGHAEMEGKTLFLKFNTGPSGHGSPAAAGEAFALLRAGCGDVRVFALEGEGGLTTGASHETKNSAWALGLSNLVYIVDWNDFGIDDHAVSSYVHGDPDGWFRPFGWRVLGTEQGSEFAPVLGRLLEAVHGDNPGLPTAVWLKTRKGRDYGKYDYKSHGAPHAMNSPEYWETKRPFAEKYGVRFEGFGEPAPADPAALREQVRTNFARAISVLRDDAGLVDYLSDRLVELGESVPVEHAGFRLRNAPAAKPAGEAAASTAASARRRPSPRASAGRGGETARHPLRGRAALRLPGLPRRHVGRPGIEAAEPRRAREVGSLGEHLGEAGVRPPPVHGPLGRPGRIDEHRGVRPRFRRREGVGQVRAARRTPRGRCSPRGSRSSRTRASRSGSRA